MPALAFLEFSSIAMGTRAADAVAKKAPLELLRLGTFQPGRFAILLAGDVASVEEAYSEGWRAGGAAVIDQVMLPDVHETVMAAIQGGRRGWGDDAVGVLETPTVAAIIRAADAAVKGAAVELVEIRLGDGLGGKGLAHFSGLVADVEAALEIGCAAISERSPGPCVSIIPRMDGDVRTILEASTRFGVGW